LVQTTEPASNTHDENRCATPTPQTHLTCTSPRRRKKTPLQRPALLFILVICTH
jgi:hypothetical protein